MVVIAQTLGGQHLVSLSSVFATLTWNQRVSLAGVKMPDML